MPALHFYFDFISPYAYFAWCRVRDFCARYQLDLVPKPVVFGKLLDHWGQLGPAEVPPKRQWLIRYCLRYAEKYKVPLAFPPQHPFKSIAALRLSLAQVAGDRQIPIIDQLFQVGWAQGQDLADENVLRSALRQVTLDVESLWDKIQSPAVKQQLKFETDEAIQLGVFGVPSFLLHGELFWGNDQFPLMEDLLAGVRFDDQMYRAILDRPRAIDRKVLQ